MSGEGMMDVDGLIERLELAAPEDWRDMPIAAAAELARQRKRTPRPCPQCGEVAPMLAVQVYCSNRCRQRAFRGVLDAVQK